MKSEPAEISRGKILLASLVIGMTLFAVYLITLCRTIYVGDSGELITASWTLGIPHSPGYPLFTMIGYLFSHIPLGTNPAVRMNFMTAFLGLLSILAIFRISLFFCRNLIIAILSSLIVGFGLVTWSQSVTTEVYTLNNFILCLAIGFIVLASVHKSRNYLLWASFFSGLAFTTHQTSLLIVPAGIWLLVKSGVLPLKGKKSIWGLSILFYLIGVAFYLYLPIAASKDPIMNWGNPSTLPNFIKTIFAPAFTQVNNGNSIDHVFYLFKIYFRELTPLGAILALIGIFGSLGRQADIRLKSLALMVLTYILFFLLTLRPVFMSLYKLDVYYLPVFVISVVFIATGASYVINFIKKKNSSLTGVVYPVLIFLMIICFLTNLVGNWENNNRSKDNLAEVYGKQLLESCDENSILMCNFDDQFILLYLQDVLGVRTDVTIILAHFPTRNDNAFWKMWIYDKLAKDNSIDLSGAQSEFFKSYAVEPIIEHFIDDNIENRPIFFTFYKIPPLELMELDYRFEPVKFCYRVTQSGQWLDTINSNLDFFRSKYSPDYFDSQFKNYHNDEEDFILVRYDELFKFNATLLKESDDLDNALYFITLSTSVNPLLWENWAVKSQIETQMGKYQDALESIEKIIQNELSVSTEITPFILDLRYEQARIYYKMGKYLEAADFLNNFYQMDARKPKEILSLAKEIEEALNQEDERENSNQETTSTTDQ